MNKLLMLLLLPLSTFASTENAVNILSQSGLLHTISESKTIYADEGDHLMYKVTEPRNGMLVITEDGVVPYKDGNSNRVLCAVVMI